MNREIRTKFDQLWSRDRNAQHQAFLYLLSATEQPVDWAYEVWDECLANLKHADNHNRAIAAQLLCNLAKSDPQQRMLKDFPTLLALTRDKRFVTARHALQALWKVAAAGEKQGQLFLEGLYPPGSAIALRRRMPPSSAMTFSRDSASCTMWSVMNPSVQGRWRSSQRKAI